MSATCEAIVTIYDGANLKENDLKQLRNGDLAGRYFIHYLLDGTQSYVSNTRHPAYLAVVDGLAIPLIINNGADSECYLTSPYINYVVSARDTIKSATHLTTRLLGHIGLGILGTLARQRACDRAVLVNNWLLATGPELSLSASQFAALSSALKSRWPGHALVFRRLSVEPGPGEAVPALLHVFYRNVYLWDAPAGPTRKTHRTYLRDRAALKNTQCEVAKLTELNNPQLAELVGIYHRLYIEKHSRFNMFLTRRWFLNMHQKGWPGVCLMLDGLPLYFVVYLMTTNELIGSVVGMSLDDPSLRLYRVGMSKLMMEAEELRLPLNLSSGSGDFKTRRGAISKPEFESVHLGGVTIASRVAWFAIRTLYNSVGRRMADRERF